MRSSWRSLWSQDLVVGPFFLLLVYTAVEPEQPDSGVRPVDLTERGKPPTSRLHFI
jgi:hypothetical protein